MSNKGFATGVVVGVVFAGVICYIIYLESEKKRSKLENDLLRQRISEGNDAKIISLNSIPEKIRPGFKEVISKHTDVAKTKQTFNESLNRVHFLKTIIEDRDGYQLFYKNGKVITKEKDLHVLYDMSWYKTHCDVNKEVNNGRGPVDFKISVGTFDQTLVEFKLASNSHLRRNILNQITIYQKANNHSSKIIVIVFMTEKQEDRLKVLLDGFPSNYKDFIVLIDARNDNKPSASISTQLETRTA